MMTVPIVDSIFTHTGAKSIGVSDEHPTYFQWKKVDGGPAIYTDFCMKDAIGQPGPKIGWLIEAPGFRQNHFDFAVEHEDEFDFILTSIKEYVVRNPYKWLWYPRGGSLVPLEDWHDWPKIGVTSMLASFKDEATGHRLRHEIYEKYGFLMDIHGSITGGRTATKQTSIAPYMFSVVVETEKRDGYFTDHLIDCIALGTMPVYWGASDFWKYFSELGAICIKDINEFESVLKVLQPDLYVERLPALWANRELARQYRKPEDWVYEHYPFIFKGFAQYTEDQFYIGPPAFYPHKVGWENA